MAINHNFLRITIPQHIGGILAIAAIATGWVSPWWLVATFVAWFLIGPLGFSTFFHRRFAHNAFQTWPWMDKTMAYLGVLAGQGHPIGFAALHVGNHHPNADRSPEDIHSPRIYGFWHAYVGWQFHPVKVRATAARRLLKDRWLVFLKDHYVKVWWGTALGLALINPWLVIFALFLPGMIHFHVECFINAACHTPWMGYRNFETNDDSVNIGWFNWLTFGSGLHHNHHHRPAAWNWAVMPGEVDPAAWLIRLIKK
jgi:stearoyl-CoA desaturase (delta-9 desaturase)